MQGQKQLRWGLVVGLLMVLSLPAHAATVDIGRSSDAIGLSVSGNRDTAGWEYGGELRLHDDDGQVIGGEIHYVNVPEPGRGAFQFGLGGRAVLIEDDNRDADGSAIALGGKLRWTLPEYNRAALAASAYFAPSFSAFSDIDSYRELSVRGEYFMLRNAAVYLGYRQIRLGFDGDSLGGDRNFESGINLGFRIDF